MTNLETNYLKILTREAASFCSRAVRTNVYDPHTGLSLSSMALQRKHLHGRMS